MLPLGLDLPAFARLRPCLAGILALAALACMPGTDVAAQTPVESPPAAAAAPVVSPPAAVVPPAVAPPAARPIETAAPAVHDLSPWAMFLGADIVVKAVMLGLAFASLVTWTILFAKSLEFSLARRRVVRALACLCDCNSLRDAESMFPKKGREVVSSLVREATDEAVLSAGIEAGGGVRDRAGARCLEVIRAEGRRLRIGTGLLATIGSTAPFVGLFGTVWGIMNSFVGIARAQTTNLAVVAPGIAEALLATAIGLVAAIPAVIIYNHFARLTKNHLELVNRASGMILRLLSRDLDRSRHGSFRLAAE